MTHTPGPWWYDTYNTIFAGSESTHDLVSICSIPDEPETGECPERHRDQWYPESAANARLIATAPELLDALKDLCAVNASTDSLDDTLARWQRASAAIAKAEGTA